MVRLLGGTDQGHLLPQRGQAFAALPLHHQHGRFREPGDPLGLLLAEEEGYGVLRLFWNAAPAGIGKRNGSVGAQKLSLQ